jgi:hypothetical protein
MRMRRSRLILFALATLPVFARAQALAGSVDASGLPAASERAQLDLTYTRPTEKVRLRSYLWDVLSPYPLLGAAAAAGVNQFDNTPPEWKQGFGGYGRRFGSDFGIAAVTTTTRYGLARAFGEDTVYYRCECTGLFPRFSHAVVSTFTARRGEYGHRAVSFPAIVSPYVGTMTAVYGWYPERYGAKDAFRMGNYSLLGYVGANVAREFIYGAPHTLLSRVHFGHSQREPRPGSTP